MKSSIFHMEKEIHLNTNSIHLSVQAACQICSVVQTSSVGGGVDAAAIPTVL